MHMKNNSMHTARASASFPYFDNGIQSLENRTHLEFIKFFSFDPFRKPCAIQKCLFIFDKQIHM